MKDNEIMQLTKNYILNHFTWYFPNRRIIDLFKMFA